MQMLIRWGSSGGSSAAVLMLLSGFGETAASAQVTISVNAAQMRQTWFGFGATHETQVLGNDVLSSSQRAQMLDLLYNQVRIRTGQIPNLFEAPQSAGQNFFGSQANDNADPFNTADAGFNTWLIDTYRSVVYTRVPATATADLYPSQNINTRWASQWLETIRQSDYNRYLDECAEQVLAGIARFTIVYGREPQFDMLFNEPTTGNGEVMGGSNTIIRDIVRRCGDRLRAAGYNTVKFVVPGQETEESSLSTATFICSDPLARQYVGAIAYHTYPYGSIYSYIPNILATSGMGTPDAGRIAVRNQLRDLGQQYGIPLWMTEVSHGFNGDNTPANMESFEGLRARAIHIHDEILYANASSYFGMTSDWSQTANILHGLGSAYGDTPETIIFTDQSHDRTFITCMGRAIGHYARFVSSGAVVLTSNSSDPLVQATAFQDQATGKLVLVVINNATSARTLNIQLANIRVFRSLTGEQSTAQAFWQMIAPIVPAIDGASITLSLPARSVTSISGTPCPGGGITCGRGDLNCDGLVNSLDIGAFVLALLSPADYAAAYPNCMVARADMNGDGAGDGADISEFLACLRGGGCNG